MSKGLSVLCGVCCWGGVCSDKGRKLNYGCQVVVKGRKLPCCLGLCAVATLGKISLCLFPQSSFRHQKRRNHSQFLALLFFVAFDGLGFVVFGWPSSDFKRLGDSMVVDNSVVNVWFGLVANADRVCW